MNPNPSKLAQLSSSRGYKRSVKNIFIHRPMQREFTLVITALLMISMFAIGFIIHDTIRDAAFGGGFHFGKINPYEVLSEVRYQLILKISSILFATLIIIAFFGVFFLHRVAGPVHRFRQVFLRLNNGHVPASFKIREGDFFMETAYEINEHVLQLNDQEKLYQQAREKLAKLIASQSNAGLSKEMKEIQDLLSIRRPQS